MRVTWLVICLIAVTGSGWVTPETKTFGFANALTITDTVIKDIPLNKNGQPPYYYYFKSHVEQKLGLNTLEDGIDSLQIRIWYGYAFKDSGQLVVLNNQGGQWSAGFYNFAYHYDDQRAKLERIAKTVVYREPWSGWDNFSRRLFELRITTLPDMTLIENYPVIADGDGIVIEVATKNKYRIYSYHEPAIGEKERVEEAKNVNAIIKLIKNEFAFPSLRR